MKGKYGRIIFEDFQSETEWVKIGDGSFSSVFKVIHQPTK